MRYRFISSLEKYRPDNPAANIPDCPEEYVAQGGICAVQLLLFADSSGWASIVGECKAGAVSIRTVEPVPVRHPIVPDGVEKSLHGWGAWPDVLMPLEEGRRIHLEAGQSRNLWITLKVSDSYRPGRYPICITIADSPREYEPPRWRHPLPGLPIRMEFTVNVAGVRPAASDFIRYEWFHSDCLAAYYRVAPWCEEHWRIVENFARNAAEHGINVLYVPLWTPPLDTGIGRERPTCQLLEISYDRTLGRYEFDFSRLERFLAIGQSVGFQRFSFSHLFSQWGALCTPKIMVKQPDGSRKKIFGWDTPSDDATYRDFLFQLFEKLLPFLRKRKINAWFSLSDEPSTQDLDHYRKLVEFVRPLLGEFQTIEAISHVEYHDAGLTGIPAVYLKRLNDFEGKTKPLLGYYCGSPDVLPNRFINMPSACTAVMGILAYVLRLDGFLHWGFNFYYSEYSLRVIDPFFENEFVGGDAFLVYPGFDGFPLDSIRNEVFAAGIRDFDLLRAAEKKIGRENVLSLLNEGLDVPISLNSFPTDSSWFQNIRRKILLMLSKSYSKGGRKLSGKS